MTGLPKPPHSGLFLRLRGYFIAGLLFSLPLIITFYIVLWIIQTIDGWIQHSVPAEYLPNIFLTFPIPGLGILVATLIFIAIGTFAKGFLGKVILQNSERFLSKMPIIRGIYSTTKQISEAVLESHSQSFHEVGLIEYPRSGIWALCFITGNTSGEVKEKTGDNMVNVFVPTTPNPTSGFLLFVPKSQIIPMAMSVEDAIKMVLSVGMITSPK
jgi:uncharacterized membrane protein